LRGALVLLEEHPLGGVEPLREPVDLPGLQADHEQDGEEGQTGEERGAAARRRRGLLAVRVRGRPVQPRVGDQREDLVGADQERLAGAGRAGVTDPAGRLLRRGRGVPGVALRVPA
jgi:hypothetical protein